MMDYQSDIFGTGTRNVYIGPDGEDAPSGYEILTPSSGTEYKFSPSDVLQFKNLIIESGYSLTVSSLPYMFLFVRDTLRIKVNGKLHMDHCGAGVSNFSPFLQKPAASYSTPSYTAACLRLFLSGREVRTDEDLKAYGGNAGNGIALSGAGTVGGGGGLVCIYHKKDGFKGYNVDTGQSLSWESTFATANGGATGSVGGGMLFISAKNIIIETNNQSEHGVISANGGDGLGVRSQLGKNPGAREDNPTGTANPAYGGGGVVHHIELDVI